jgi:hypothetical protein
MTKGEMIDLLKSDVERWNEWRRDHPEFLIDLENVNFSNRDLSGADFSKALLSFADFNNTSLYGVDLEGAHIFVAYLDKANLRDANLADTVFSQCSLEDVDFSGAILMNTSFDDVDLRGAKGLETIRHAGPSTVGIDTIYRSGGKIPESFLRGTGVPEEFIRFIPSLIGAQEGIQFYSCFISYSHRDEEFAQRLHARMRAANLRVWYAPEDMKGGRKIHEQIETAIHVQDKLLLVLSEASMASEWVATEIYHARQREKREKRQILFPIRLCPFNEIEKWKAFDADTGKDMAREVREYLIPDFSGWKDHDKFEAAFAKLLRDLKADAPPPASA